MFDLINQIFVDPKDDYHRARRAYRFLSGASGPKSLLAIAQQIELPMPEAQRLLTRYAKHFERLDEGLYNAGKAPPLVEKKLLEAPRFMHSTQAAIWRRIGRAYHFLRDSQRPRSLLSISAEIYLTVPETDRLLQRHSDIFSQSSTGAYRLNPASSFADDPNALDQKVEKKQRLTRWLTIALIVSIVTKALHVILDFGSIRVAVSDLLSYLF